MPSCRSLLLPIALAAAAPAHATQVCAWMEETIEPYDEEMPAEDAAAEDYTAVAEADDVMTAGDENAGSALDVAEEAAAAAEAASDAVDAAAEAVDAADAAAEAAAAAPEYVEPGVLNLKLWLQADGDAEFYYKMAGEGLVEDSGNRVHSPNSGTYVLSRGEPSSPWGLGMTFAPPGRIDVVVEVREYPEDIFSDEETPLLATFRLARRIPAGETTPPATLARRQCKDITFPPRKEP